MQVFQKLFQELGEKASQTSKFKFAQLKRVISSLQLCTEVGNYVC